MVDAEEIRVGTRVRLVDSWEGASGIQNRFGKMDRYLGMVVTIKRVLYGSPTSCSFEILEDTRTEDEGLPQEAPIYRKWVFDNSMVAEVLPSFEEMVSIGLSELEEDDFSLNHAAEMIGSLL